MKKLFLLLAAGSIAMTVGAQERQLSVVNVNNHARPVQDGKFDANFVRQMGQYLNRNSHTGLAGKSTAGGDRWYNYADFIDSLANFNATYGVTPGSAAFSEPYMWNDTTSQDDYTTGISYNTFVSEGSVLDPKYHGFNDGNFYAPGTMAITAGDAYVCDTVIVVGDYGMNAARMAAGVVDTLRLSIVEGSGSGGKFTAGAKDIYSDNGISGTHWGSPSWMDFYYDSTGKNRAASYFNGTNYDYVDVPLSQATIGGDTLSLSSLVFNRDNESGVGIGAFYKKIALPTPVACAAGDFVGMSISFKSGDATFTAGSTVFTTSSTYNFSMFRPLISYFGTAGGTPTYDWPLYNFGGTDNNVGLFKTLPDTAKGWGHQYIPEWAWSSSNGTAASDLQSPYIWYHLTCASCATTITQGYLGVNSVNQVNSVKAFPNPAVDVLNIAYDISQLSDITISLTNMLGQTVSSQKFSNALVGKAVFNTAALPAGIYIYTLEAGGNRSTGQIAIAH